MVDNRRWVPGSPTGGDSYVAGGVDPFPHRSRNDVSSTTKVLAEFPPQRACSSLRNVIVIWKESRRSAVGRRMLCAECGEVLLDERVELGYDYCTDPECQKRRHRGLKVTTVAVHKSADTVLIADDGEISRRGESGELNARDTGLALNYRATPPATRRTKPDAPPGRRARATPAGTRAPRWSRTQEEVVRLYHDMGLRPDQIVERARQNNPRLGITRSLVHTILATRPGGD
jgi:hypothetical protein